jgi:hypothetical protein
MTMKKILILIILNSALMFQKAWAWTGDKILPITLPGPSIAETISLVLTGSAILSLSIILRKSNRKVLATHRQARRFHLTK